MSGNNQLVAATPETPILITLGSAAASNLAVSEAFIIDSPEMFEIGSSTLREIRGLVKQAEAERKKITEPLHRAKVATDNLFKPITNKLEVAAGNLSRKLIAFEDQQRARIEAEERAAAEERRKEIEAAEAALRETEAAFKAGEATREQLIEADTKATIAAVATNVGMTAAPVSRGGNARRDRFVAEIVNVPALLRFLADSIERGDTNFDNTVEFKLGQLNAFGDSCEGKLVVPGVEWKKESKMIGRS